MNGRNHPKPKDVFDNPENFLDFLTDADIANAHFTQALIHIDKHTIHHALGEVIVFFAQRARYQKDMQRDQIEAAIDRIGNL